MTGCASTEGDTDDTTASAEPSSQSRRPDDNSAPTAGETGADTHDRKAPGEIATDATDRQRMASDESLNDAQILGVVKIANESEVATGQLAVQKSMTPEVRDFAQDMVQDHLAAGQHVDQTATAAPPSGSQLATQMVEEANEKIESLNAQSGAAFDRAYVESQVEAHQELLDAIENRLLPEAESAPVKQLLESVREKVNDHLQQARQLQQQIASIAG